MEKQNSYLTKPISQWNLNDWKDFYNELKRLFEGELIYIRNKSGGYNSFLCNLKSSKIKGKEFDYFLELAENKLFFKIAVNNRNKRREVRNFYRNILNEKANELNIKISLFDRLGEIIKIAELNSDYLITNKSKIVDLQKTCYNLKSITKLIDKIEKEINNLSLIKN